MNDALAIVLTIVADILIYLTLPLQIRILIVIMFPKRKLNLDPSFHTLMIHATIVNIIFAIDHCLIQEPASLGVFLQVYELLGPYLEKIEMIKSTLLVTIGSILHTVLSGTRLTAIIFPLKHARIWEGKRLSYACIGLWIVAALACIPLFLPNSTMLNFNTNVFGGIGIEYGFVGQYNLFYSIGCSIIAGVVELVTMLAYAVLLSRINSFKKFSLSGAENVKRAANGVIRTTLASVMISMGSWIVVFFFIYLYMYQFSAGQSPFTKLEFAVWFKFLNGINNVLTPWVLFLSFPKVRKIVFNRESTDAVPPPRNPPTRPTRQGRTSIPVRIIYS